MFTSPVPILLLCLAAICLLLEPLFKKRLPISVCGVLSCIAAIFLGLLQGARLQEILIVLLLFFLFSLPALLWGNRRDK